MKTKISIVTLLIFLSIWHISAQESFPSFNKEYWESEQASAQGKITRGAALGIAGALLLWPTAITISRSRDNPQKYLPLSIILGATSIGAMAHGFSSIHEGKKEREQAQQWIDTYTTSPDSVNREQEQRDYLATQQLSAQKTTVFGVYATTIATALLTSGIIQSTQGESFQRAKDIHPWPYYTIGGALLPMGIAAIVSSRKKAHSLSDLEQSLPPVSSINSQWIPFVTLGNSGELVFGAVYSLHF